MNFDPRMLLPLAVLGALLGAAVWHDLRSRRIPNRLVWTGMLAGVALQTALPAGAGLYSAPFGALGLGAALAGLALGLALLLPMYALGALGAGDVKLLAMTGVFLGPRELLGAALLTLLSGGLLALAVALAHGQLRQVMANLRVLLLHALLQPLAGGRAGIAAPPVATGKLAYAVAIAVGTALHILLAATTTWSTLL